MEMQQVRYFLALARTLNFTRAAEECHVTQPALTRSIKLLEDELGGALIRRERSHSHLTELGRRMQPMLQQCYDAAVSAKSLAKAVQGSEIAPMSVAVSHCVNTTILARHFAEIARAFPGVELRMRRGPASAVAAALRNGDVDLAIAGPIEHWERLDAWPLFREGIDLMVGPDHPLARTGATGAALDQLAGEIFLRRVECEIRSGLAASLPQHGPAGRVEHEVETDHDLLALVEANVGVAFLSATGPQPAVAKRVKLLDHELWRTIAVYSVAGRMRSGAAAMLLNLLRGADWSALGVSEPA